MDAVDRGLTTSDNSVDAAWGALCAELEATVMTVASKFARTAQAHLSFTEVHHLAELVDLAEDGQPLNGRLVEFATQCLTQVVERAVRTRFRPKYFSEHRCLNTLWEQASGNRRRRPATAQHYQ
ncbi:MAG TPA: hypothetical protein VH183_02100 [Burkholderiaceae bacterium]|jgi:hypothetical protein|nr:hypothetical protein [Burkholderiaceae bacterium]